MLSLPEPIDGNTKVLRDLLSKPFVTPRNYPTGFRLGARIFELRHDYEVEIHTGEEKFTNEFGRPGSCAKYSLTLTASDQKEKLIAKYLSLVKKQSEPA